MKFCKLVLRLPQMVTFLAFSTISPIVKGRELLYSISIEKRAFMVRRLHFPLLFSQFCHNLFRRYDIILLSVGRGFQ